MNNKILTSDYCRCLPWLVSQARRSCFCCFYLISLASSWRSREILSFLNALDAALARGVDVRVVLNCVNPAHDTGRKNIICARWLAEKKIPVHRFNRPVVVHSKFIVVDDELFVLGSHNLSYSSLFRSLETSVLLRDPDLASELSDKFKWVWKNSVDFFPL